MRPHTVVRGTRGTPVLMLHGIGGCAGSFDPQMEAFAAGHRVVAWDAPGYARSADPARAPGMSGYAAAAAYLIPEGAHVVGVSWGGVIATRLAAEHPRLVRSLVLVGSSRGSGRTPQGREAMLARAADLERLGPEEFAARRGPRLVSPDAPAELVDRVVTAMARSVRLPGYAYAAASMADTDHSDVLGALTVPALVVVGDRDTVTGPAESGAIAAALPHARLEVLAGAGHVANQQRPDEFNRVVLRFLREVEQ
ncbi:alpha/beta hydrolase [Actinomadura sp. NPDC047616]|uniref:alpha/beta fold hydrolase n=1 Tax=Actinomadura sp. NPDC047616 TaxID=3155914 RepID=UPI0033DA8C4B